MVFDILILALVLGYSAWLILRAVRRRRAGQSGCPGCGGCSGCGCGGCSAGKEAGHTHG